MTKALVLDDSRPLMDKVQDFIRVVDAKIGLERVLLFGSTAKRRRRKNSDVDLIVVSESFRGRNSLERAKILLEDWVFVEELDLLMYTPEEFDNIKQRLLVREMLADALDLTPNRDKR